MNLPTSVSAGAIPAPKKSVVKSAATWIQRITILTALSGPMTKTISIKGNKLEMKPYSQAKHFTSKEVEITGLASLLAVLTTLKNMQVLIRGLADKEHHRTTRTKENFPEAPDGSAWCMLDIDDQPLPDGMSPTSPEAVEWVVKKLPPEFQAASFIYQFSGSAGIRNPDGVLHKAGLNVHLFFLLKHPIQGRTLAAYLSLHCLNTAWFTFRDGTSAIKYGLDMSTIVNAVQPLYVAPPIVKQGVVCDIADADRIALVKKDEEFVDLPGIGPTTIAKASAAKDKLIKKLAKKQGLVSRSQQVSTSDGIALVRFYANPNAATKTGRKLVDVVANSNGQSIRLYLEGEKSPGSWFVKKLYPTVAIRFGDHTRVPLQELCPEAYVHVRDRLGWFNEVEANHLTLDEDGRLPPLATFIKRRVSKVIAPTGSGKTKNLMDWIKDCLAPHDLVIYVAPRIVLLDQMGHDLTKAGIPSTPYTEIKKDIHHATKVVLTTLQSLRRIMETNFIKNRSVHIVFDEIHIVLDDAMSEAGLLSTFEHAIYAARSVIMLTGTMTDVQEKALTQVVEHALPGYGLKNYASYHFPSVKKNPLEVVPSQQFGSDFVRMMDEFKGLLESGKGIPRSVFIVDTSRLEGFRVLLKEAGLLDMADVVSRRESTNDEIDEAVSSGKPIMITTTLFSTGLNLSFEPERLLVCLDRISADTNMINQTINRANRGDIECIVRLYCSSPKMDYVPTIPAVVKKKVEKAFDAECTIGGFLEEYFQIDRTTYLALRDAERNTAVSARALLDSDGFQNYEVVGFSDSGYDKNLDNSFKAARAAGRQVEEQLTLEFYDQAKSYDVDKEPFFKLSDLKNNYAEMTPAEIGHRRDAIIMHICSLGKPSQARSVDETKLSVLFAVSPPWLSDQHRSTVAGHINYARVEKMTAALEVIKFLMELKEESFTANSMVSRLTRGQALMQGFLALEHSDIGYIKLHDRFEKLKASRAMVRGMSEKARQAITDDAMKMLAALLASLGVHFDKTKGSDGRYRTNYTKPIVPASFNLKQLDLELRAHIERYSLLGNDARILTEDSNKADEFGHMRSLSLCADCVFRHGKNCTKQHVLDFWEEEFINTTWECRDYRPITQRQQALIATNMQDFVATKSKKIIKKQ